MVRFLQDYFLNGAQFYNLFGQAAKNASEMASLLENVVNTGVGTDREPIFKHIDKLENTGDDITHKIYLALDKVVFTPLNRKDIHTLASAIDDVADYIHEASERMYLYNVCEFVPAIKEIAAIVLKATLEIETSVNLLGVKNNEDDILASCRQIKDYERQSDQVYYNALALLFTREKDAIKLIKYREVLHSLETTTNKCKNAADVLQAILINSF
jgi:predicted phosphate transport protein (TIGR00153 family)